MTKFLVVKTWFMLDNRAKFNGSDIIGHFDKLEDAKECLRKEAESWMANKYAALNDVRELDGVESWVPGYQNNNEVVSFSSAYFDKDCMVAWALSSEDDFEKVEIKEFKFD